VEVSRTDKLAYVGLGSNLDDPVAQVRAGLRALSALDDTRVECSSSLYRSEPVGLKEQPDFVNAACRLRTSLAPARLLQDLLLIERTHGRVRGLQTGGPRTLDLDLLLYGQETHHAPDLILPHPRLHERAFVLYPLLELDPDLVVPGHGPAARLLTACTGQRVERLDA
jgi:2-amino-4-hydroxy-6-hydroxymethyldihydropteridine diphosphokinase